MNQPNNLVMKSLVQAGIQKDDVKEILSTGKVLLDKEVAKEFVAVFIEIGVPFKCEPDIDDLIVVTLLG